jgi:hypothetical protein
LGTKSGRSATVGAVEVAYIVDAFQLMNQCILSISFELTLRKGTPDLMVIATAYTVDNATAERVVLVSFRSSLSALNCVSLEAATTLALYRIDGLLAAREMEAGLSK